MFSPNRAGIGLEGPLNKAKELSTGSMGKKRVNRLEVFLFGGTNLLRDGCHQVVRW